MKEELFKEEACFKQFLSNFKVNPNNMKLTPSAHTNMEEGLEDIRLKKSHKQLSHEEGDHYENEPKTNDDENEKNYKKKLRTREGRFKQDPFHNFEKRRKRKVMQTQRLQKVFIEENKDELICSICLGTIYSIDFIFLYVSC